MGRGSLWVGRRETIPADLVFSILLGKDTSVAPVTTCGDNISHPIHIPACGTEAGPAGPVPAAAALPGPRPVPFQPPAPSRPAPAQLQAAEPKAVAKARPPPNPFGAGRAPEFTPTRRCHQAFLFNPRPPPAINLVQARPAPAHLPPPLSAPPISSTWQWPLLKALRTRCVCIWT